MDAKKRIEQLVEEINTHNYNYYVLDNPTVSNKEWDELYDELIKLEAATGYILPNSPSQRVGDAALLSGFKKFTHINKLYSLDKCNNYDDLKKWILAILQEFPQATFVVEHKFDGLRMTVAYENGKFVRAVTRGNGVVGEDVTAQAATIQSIPKTISFKGNLTVEGEAMMRNSVLLKYNKTAQEKLKNARNAAAGALRNLDPEVTRSRNLDLFLYGVVDIQGKTFNKYTEITSFLKEQGLPMFGYQFESSNADEIVAEVQRIDKTKNELDVLTDGAVIKVNNLKFREEIGYTSKFPKWAIAYKYEAQEAATILNNIIWQVGRTGKVTPIAEVEPVELAGATIKRATLNNYGDILRKDVKINSRVFLRRSNEVIPEILGAAEHFASSIEVVKPTQCPSCGAAITETGAHLFCTNYYNCPDQIDNRIIHFAGRNAMNIEGLSDKTVSAARTYLGVHTVADLYKLSKEDLLKLDKFKDKKTVNLLESINKSKVVAFPNFIFALGINNVGEKTAKDLAKRFADINALTQAAKEDLMQIRDIGGVVADSIYSFFRDEKQLLLLKELLTFIEIKYEDNSMIENAMFTNKNVVLTGELVNYTRSDLTKLLEKFGAHVVGSVSKNTHLVIVGENPGSKYTKAKQLGVAVITEEELLTALNK